MVDAFKPMWMICEGGFGCDCVQRRARIAPRLKNLAGHGKRAKYLKGCRCSLCKKANAKYIKKYREKHGTNAHYLRGCRCDECREAHNAYGRERYRIRKENQ